MNPQSYCPDNSGYNTPMPRRFQFSLRTVLIVMSIAAAALGWWSHKARQQREAVQVFTQAGGRVSYDFQELSLEGPRYSPKWLVNVLGVDFFANVEEVILPNNDDIATKVAYLKNFTSLRSLWLSYSHVTDANLQQLQGLKALRFLSLPRTQVTDAGLEHLKNLSNLEELYLAETQVTDAGLEHLKPLTALKSIDLRLTKVTDAGVERLQRALPNSKIDR
ncbi:MAG: hypothetical protein K8T91_28475 [Planctomycetes bacterium]|nr:hypothetical protein [Planctomycetota bacterium]